MRSMILSERGSLTVSHTMLLGIVLVLAISITTAGIGPVGDAQGSLSTIVMSDEFEEWDSEIGNSIKAKAPKRKSLSAPPGEIKIGDETTITIESDEGGGQRQELSTAQFRFKQDGDSSATRVIYDAGLITQKQRATGSPIVLEEPRQSSFNPPSGEVVLLNLIEYNISRPVSRSSSTNNNVKFDVYPDPENATKEVFTTNPTITIQGSNAESWERFFADNSEYTINEGQTNLENNNVTADIAGSQELHLNSRRVRLIPQ